MDLQEVLLRLLQAELHVGSSVILWREIIGNGFGLASALLGMFRKVAAWPVGIVGNVLLFTVFVGTAIGKISIGECLRTIWPFWLSALAVLLVVAFVPELSLWLPSVLKS